MAELKRKPHYTTTELAAILRVRAAAIAKVFDSGELKGWRGPGGARYVPHPALVRWLRTQSGYEATLKWLEAA